jgi:Mn2+/Fe2+ NRAMP family transporter
MIRLLTVVFIVASASPVLAVQKPDSIAITVRERAVQACTVLTVFAFVLPLGVKRPDARRDYVGSMAAASNNETWPRKLG